ncbi:hypothetical protein JCM10207_000856 [Rhodosporidiobolus poonsookiae]
MKATRTALRHTRHRSPALPATALRSSSSLLASSSRTEVGRSQRLDGGRRTLFGVGEILGVLANPTEVLRSLSESKKLLEEARQELQEAKERSQIPTSHTFSPLPGFFNRPNEIKAIERALGSVPAFTVLFGASSTGKTALLRQVLSSDRYHILSFDLRISGFADLASLYFSLSTQLESYFAAIPDLLGREYGWGEFEKESWAFKHDRIEIQKRLKDGGEVKTSDVAHLLELFQSALLSYWKFQPMTEAQRQRAEQRKQEEEEKEKDEKQTTKASSTLRESHQSNDPTEARMRQGAVAMPEQDKHAADDLIDARSVAVEAEEKAKAEEEEEDQPPPKRVPVFFIDEAHKLPALIQSEETMKCFLDAMLVLTKQDRLCHVVHASSDAYYLHWLRQMNIMQHCQILSIGDTSKAEAERYFEEVLVPHIPEELRAQVDFEELYAVFGGKLAHLSDYVSEFINSAGEVTPRYSSHFLQAHSLLNLQLIHSMPQPTAGEEGDAPSARGFQIYSALAAASPHSAPSPYSSDDGGPSFHPSDLLTVMRRLQPGAEDELPYFPLCRELGARAVDGMVRGKVLELRWSRVITDEGDPDVKTAKERNGRVKEVGVGPVVVPTTPVVRWAMGEVLKEYEAEGWTAGSEKKRESE